MVLTLCETHETDAIKAYGDRAKRIGPRESGERCVVCKCKAKGRDCTGGGIYVIDIRGGSGRPHIIRIPYNERKLGK
jgi:hypothetical protein